MKDNGIRPNVISFNAVLNACEHTGPSPDAMEEALKIACAVFDQVRKESTVEPNHVTKGTFLAAVGALIPSATSRQEIVALVFSKCCRDGLVSNFVLRKLESVAETEYRDLLQGHTVSKLPLDWTCRVRESRAREES